MQNLVSVVILVIGGVFLAMTVVILANKAWRESVALFHGRRRRVLEPAVLDYAHRDDVSLLAAIGGELKLADRHVMESILLDHAQRVRGIERDRLCRAIDELGYVDRYLRRLHSRRWWSRADGAERLGLAGAARAIPELVRALDDDVSEVRMRAAKSLGSLGGSSSIRPLIRALNQPNRWSTIRIADILTSMGREVVDELMEMFGELSLPGKVAALDILGRIHPLRAIEWLKLRAADAETDVRARACHALGMIGDPSTATILVDRLKDEEWPVRAMAAKALGKVRNAETIPSLCEALRDREWWARANAAEALRELGRPGADALTRMLEDDDTYARHQAVQMLEQSGIVDAQVGKLADNGSDRAAAERLLKRVIAAGRTSRLHELANGHPDERVRHGLAELLGLEGAGA